MKNFVVQKSGQQKKIKYIDLKSFNKSKFWTFLKLEYYIKPFARFAMRKRIKRLYKELEIK